MEALLGQDYPAFKLVTTEDNNDVECTFSQDFFADNDCNDELWLIRMPLEVELDDGIHWHVLSGRAGNIVAKADDRENAEDIFLRQHDNDSICFGASYPVSRPVMISKVFGVYSASNASKVCFGRDADFQAEKITEDEEADKIKTAVKVETKLEKRRAENSEAGTPDNGHKRKKKKTRKK